MLVDVVVSGKHGTPVSGLHKEDFLVSEDGVPQTITSFEEHTGQPPTQAEERPLSKDTAPNVFTNVPQTPSNGSLLILLLDSLNTPSTDQNRVRNTMLQYLQKLQPGRQVAVFTLGSELRCIQGITGDASLLSALANDAKSGLRVDPTTLLDSKTQAVADKTTVAQLSDAGHGMAQDGFGNIADHVASFQQAQVTLLSSGRELMTLDAFLQLARYLSGIPGRKNVAWFSGSFPDIVYSAAEALEPFKMQRDYSEHAKATEAALIAARVAIYPISAVGLNTGSFFESDTQLTSHRPQDAQVETHDMLAADGKVHNQNLDSMNQVAQATGGEAIYNTNDLNNALSRVADDGSHYYTLFYTPTGTASANEYRKIAVKVTGGHYKLAFNRGYFARDRPDEIGAAAQPGVDPLQSYLRPEVLDSTQIPLELRVEAINPSDARAVSQTSAPPGSRCSIETLTGQQPTTCYKVRFDVGAASLQFDNSQVGLHQDSLELTLLVSDKEGKTLSGLTSKVRLKLDDARYAYVLAHGTHLELEIGAPQGGVNLRGGVYDVNSGLAGTLKVPLASLADEKSSPNLTKVSLAGSTSMATTATPEAAGVASSDTLAEAAGSVSSKVDTVPIPPPQPTEGVEAPTIPESAAGPNAAAVFWTLPPKTVSTMLASAPIDNHPRYSLLRQYFTKFGCAGTHLSEEQVEQQTGQNLICMLPGSSSQTIVVTARYEHRANEDADGRNWTSAIMLARLYKALQAQPRHYSFVFVELCDDEGEKQFLQSLASANLATLVAVVGLDIRGTGPLNYQLSQAEPHAQMGGLVTDDEALRLKAIRNGEATKGVLTTTLLKSAQLNKLAKPVQLDATPSAGAAQLFHRSTYIPSILIYNPTKPHHETAATELTDTEGIFNLLGTYLCGLDSNLSSR